MPQKNPVTTAVKTSAAKTSDIGTRKLKKPAYRSFKLQKKIPKEVTGHPLPSTWRLLKGALKVLRQNWKVMLGIVFIYGILNLVLVKGLSAGANVADLKDTMLQGADGNWATFLSGTIIFSYLLSSSSSPGATQSAGTFQVLLLLVISLAIIWTLRQIYAGTTVRIRDGFYQGMTPFITMLLVVLVIFAQLVPFAIGAYLYATVMGIGVSGAEIVIWVVAFSLLVILSLYLLTSSLFALYIVCLPGTRPWQALKAARSLVRFRRWTVMRKILFLPFILLLIAAVIMIPLIAFLPVVAVWVFFVLSLAALPIVHSYMYGLYRELL